MWCHDLCYYQGLPHAVCFVQTYQREDGMLSMLDSTTWVFLDASKKIVYLRYRRFLKTTHKYCGKMYFRYYDNKPEIEPPLER